MGPLMGLVLITIAISVNGFQKQYKIFLEDLRVEYVDEKYMDIKAELYKLNETNKAANTTITLKLDLPEDAKLTMKALKFFNNKYQPTAYRLEKRLKEALEMEAFDVQNICLNYTRPPVVWPLQKNVAYHLIGWTPDASKYPQFVPEGKWKIEQNFELVNKFKLAVASWFAKVQYN